MDERFLERAEANVLAAQERAMHQVAQALHGNGSSECIDCGEEIEPKRRAAAPFAVRCLTCQQMNERRA